MTQLRLRTLTACDKTIITTRGDIDLSTTPLLEAELSSLVRNANRVVVNLSYTSYVDSSGLAALMRAHKALRNSGGQLTVIGCQPSVSRVMHLVGFQHMFSIEERPRPRERRLKLTSAMN